MGPAWWFSDWDSELSLPRGTGSIPGEGTKILQATQCGKNRKTNKNTVTTGSETTTEKQITDSSKLTKWDEKSPNVVGPDMANTN